MMIKWIKVQDNYMYGIVVVGWHLIKLAKKLKPVHGSA